MKDFLARIFVANYSKRQGTTSHCRNHGASHNFGITLHSIVAVCEMCSFLLRNDQNAFAGVTHWPLRVRRGSSH